MKLGAHVSSAQNLSGAVKSGQTIGAEVIQIFTSNPKAWSFNMRGDEELAEYKKQLAASKIEAVYGHSIYLTNLASQNNYIYTNSINLLVSGLVLAQNAGFSGVVTHVGSHGEADAKKGLERVTNALQQALTITENKVQVLLETDSGAGTHLGAKFEEIAEILAGLDGKNVGVCFDTCHCLVAGYDLATPKGFDKVLAEFDRVIGRKHLKLFHLNDSKGALGSHLDRHEVIGAGEISAETFKHIVTNPEFADIPGIVETPDNRGEAGEAGSLDILKGLRDG